MSEQNAYMGKGLVKEVQSGDCVTILVSNGGSGARSGPPQELVLTLASLDAPRLSRRNGDAAFAQQAREFLRSKCAGKLVTFKVEYKVPSINRTFGTLFVDGSEDVSLSVVEAGFAAVKPARTSNGGGANDGECSEQLEELLALQESAKAAGNGMWTTNKRKIAAASVKVRHAGDEEVTPEELEEVFRKIEGKPVEAIVEYVRDGAMMRVQLVDFHLVVPFALAGVACPSHRGKGVRLPDGTYDDSQAKPEPYAAVAKQFTETRLLSRRVNILCLAGPRKFNTFFGKVEHPKGDISVEIVKAGLGKISDWTLRYTPNRLSLRRAERAAKQKRLRVWKHYTPPETGDLPSFSGNVLEVNSGDTIVVEDADTEEAHRVSLSSIRVPFGGTRDGSKPAEAFSLEAREALRNMVIGKPVKVSVDYVRFSRNKDGSERSDAPQRSLATVIAGKTNVALELVKRGLASVIRHREEEPRSGSYDDLLEAEMHAEKARVGIHGNKKKAQTPPIDSTRNNQKAKQFLSFLTRPGETTHQGVVEYCFNASSYKVYIPKENVIVRLNLVGVSTPRTGRPARNGKNAEPGEPCAEEASKFIKRSLLNRDVTVEIEGDNDRGAGLALVFAKIGGKKTNVNLELLKRGYGRLVRWSADKSRVRSQLYDMCDEARDARIGMWENWAPTSRAGNGEDQEDAASSLVGKQRVHVSHIDDARTFFVTVDSEEHAAALERLQQIGSSLEPVSAEALKKKAVVAIDFNGEWCRVRIDHITREEAKDGAAEATEEGAEAGPLPAVSAQISYLDFGNTEKDVSPSHLRALPEDLASMSAAAIQAHLAFVKAPKLGSAVGQDAGEMFHELTWGKSLLAEILPADDNGVPVILYDAAASTEATEPSAEEGGADEGNTDGASKAAVLSASINEQLLKAGLARVRRARRRFGRSREAETPRGPHAKLQKSFNKFEEIAHRQHAGIWQYGDPGDSDDNQ